MALAALRMLAGAALAILTCECLLRGLQFFPVLYADRELGYKVNSGRIVWSEEGFGRSVWRGPLGIRAKGEVEPGGILVLGDCFTEALQVDDGEDYPALLQASLGVPVYNAGKSGQAFADKVAAADAYRKRLRPRWTVVQFVDPTLEEQLFEERPVTYVREPGGALRLVRSPQDPRPERIYHHSATVVELYRRVLMIRAQERPLFSARPAQSRGKPRPTYTDMEEVLSQTARAYGNRVTFLLVARYEPSQPGAISQVEKRCRRFCEANGLGFLSTSVFHAELATDGRSLCGFSNTHFNAGHLNGFGHRKVAELLEPELRKRLGRP